MAADNDISEFADYSIHTMGREINIKDPRINVEVFCDGRNRSIGISNALVYRLESDGMNLKSNLGSVDSGSVDTFKRFLDRAIKPSKRNILIVWGHSSEQRNTGSSVMLNDEDSGSSLTLNQFIDIVKYTKEKLGCKLDLLGLDACSMLYAEVVYDLKDYVHYVAGTVERQDAFSWNYKSMISWINNNPLSDIEGLFRNIIDSYQYFYQWEVKEINIKDKSKKVNHSFSVVNLNRISEVKSKFNTLISSLLLDGSFNSDVKKRVVRDVIKRSRVGKGIDIIQFLERLSTTLSDSGISKYSDDISEIVKLFGEGDDRLIFGLYKESESSVTRGLNLRDITPGLSVSRYHKYSFDGTTWIEFLTDLFNIAPTTYFSKEL